MKTLKSMLGISFLIGIAVYGCNNFWVSERDIEVPAFSSVFAKAPVHVYLERGNQNKVRMRADDNVHDKMTIEVKDGQLRIFNNTRISRERVLEVYVTYRDLDRLEVTGAATLVSRSVLDTDSLNIVANGGGEAKIRVNCQHLDLEMYGAANVFLAGTADVFDFNIHAVGDLTAYNFEALKCKATMITGDQSPGIARINVSEELAVHIDGPRYLYYRGSPTITSQIIEGEGKLIKK